MLPLYTSGISEGEREAISVRHSIVAVLEGKEEGYNKIKKNEKKTNI